MPGIQLHDLPTHGDTEARNSELDQLYDERRKRLLASGHREQPSSARGVHQRVRGKKGDERAHDMNGAPKAVAVRCIACERPNDAPRDPFGAARLRRIMPTL